MDTTTPPTFTVAVSDYQFTVVYQGAVTIDTDAPPVNGLITVYVNTRWRDTPLLHVSEIAYTPLRKNGKPSKKTQRLWSSHGSDSFKERRDRAANPRAWMVQMAEQILGQRTLLALLLTCRDAYPILSSPRITDE